MCFILNKFFIVSTIPSGTYHDLNFRSSNHNYSFHMQRAFTLGCLNSFRITVACSVLPFISQTKHTNECTWGIMYFPVNVNKLLAVLLLPVYFLIPFLYWCCCSIFCLFVGHINNPIIFVFGYFVYNFNNTISIFVKICNGVKSIWRL